VSSATGYQVYRATSSTGTFSLVSTVTTNSYTDSSVNWGKTCYYKIRAYTTSGKTIYSAYSPVVSAKLTLEVPANLKTTKASSTTLKLTWNSVSGANGYEVYFSPSTYCWDPYTLVVSTSSLSYTMTGISAGKSYYNFYCFKVRAYRTVNGVKVYSDYTPVVIFKY
jgi:fibronectin type 3 domain-containing protein